jgi:hypothetical protein
VSDANLKQFRLLKERDRQELYPTSSPLWFLPTPSHWQNIYWGFQFSGTWHCVVRWVVTNILTDCSDFIFRHNKYMLNEVITPLDEGNTICLDAGTTHSMTQQSHH